MSTASAGIRTVVTGVHGRMGSALARLLRSSKQLALAGATERAGLTASPDPAALAVPVHEELSQALDGALGGKPQVVIDFTSAKASVAHARTCAERGVALVIGSTGLSGEEKAAIGAAAQRIPIVLAPNMSVGVNLVVQVAAHLARVLGEAYDVEIVETHHRLKKDAPSGTALRLAEEIAHALGRGEGDIRTERSGQVGERPAKEIGVQALRGGDVVGEHTVYFLGEGERVELTHRATNRDTFAAGALRAAAWVVGQPPGLYDMQDVLGLKA